MISYVGTSLTSVIEKQRLELAERQQSGDMIRRGARSLPRLPLQTITEVAARTIEPDGTEP